MSNVILADCVCGHTNRQHATGNSHRCLACLECCQRGVPLREPHAMVRCMCETYRPEGTNP